MTAVTLSAEQFEELVKKLMSGGWAGMKPQRSGTKVKNERYLQCPTPFWFKFKPRTVLSFSQEILLGGFSQSFC